MRTVTLEEHFLLVSDVKQRFDPGELNLAWLDAKTSEALEDLGPGRIAAMDANGIDVQVLSASIPGADLLDGARGIDFARFTNDRLAAAVREYPGRFSGFAHLPMREPPAAVKELERAVSALGFRGAMINGLTEGRFLDDERYGSILAACQDLDVPLYLHPNVPPKAVVDAYYSGLPGVMGAALATGVFGWHAETAIHVLRLVLSGTLERYPRLKLIVGHMGEMLPFMMARADQAFSNINQPMRPSKIISERVYITTSGFFTTPPFLNALQTFGADRIMFSVDYPFAANEFGRQFLDTLPVSTSDKRKIAHENADRLLKL
jgi:predicted TIM-barrel fold metal-dependent hydrolase